MTIEPATTTLIRWKARTKCLCRSAFTVLTALWNGLIAAESMPAVIRCGRREAEQLRVWHVMRWARHARNSPLGRRNCGSLVAQIPAPKLGTTSNHTRT